MPHVSKRKLNKIDEKELIQSLNLVMAKISGSSEMETFLESLLTKTEQIMLAKRLAIVILLKEEIPQANIANALKVTQATVSRMQLFLEARGNVGYDIALGKLENEKILKDFKILLVKIAGYSIRAAGGYVKPEIT